MCLADDSRWRWSDTILVDVVGEQRISLSHDEDGEIELMIIVTANGGVQKIVSAVHVICYKVVTWLWQPCDRHTNDVDVQCCIVKLKLCC